MRKLTDKFRTCVVFEVSCSMGNTVYLCKTGLPKKMRLIITIIFPDPYPLIFIRYNFCQCGAEKNKIHYEKSNGRRKCGAEKN